MISGTSTSGTCRGPGYNQNGWPQFAGGLSFVDCIAACDSRADCTAIDLGMDTGHCYLWGHTNVQAEAGNAECWKKKQANPSPQPGMITSILNL